ncbi:E3 ubiquitin-protein ligase UBR4-like [Choristoneura fumiferana]|uniref:E3 ubiquitin-protein ligase UBR4-like n=1 Tax=Choristoneura fumiferana TaxID=7141 RepID=UPI003D15ABAF
MKRIKVRSWEPVPSRRAKKNWEPVPSRRAKKNWEPVPSRRAKNNWEPVPSRRAKKNWEPVPSRRAKKNWEPVPSRRAKKNWEPVPSRRAKKNWEPVPSRQKTSNRRPTLNDELQRLHFPGLMQSIDTTAATPAVQLLKPQAPHPLPDMQPFFVKEYVKSHALDVFDNYPQLLMEMALRLPCQIHKHCDPSHFDARWRTLLCEYMMNQQTPLRKQVRKLLLLLCGTRDRYRHTRDVHALDTHLSAARVLLQTDPAYDKLVQLMDHLKACAEIVSARTGNWQHTCATERREALAWLVRCARRVHPHVAPTVLQLLQAALCSQAPAQPDKNSSASGSTSEWTERERSADSDAFVSDGSKFQEHRVPQLVQQILKQVSQDELKMFVKAFLLETNSTAVRWQAHALLLAIYKLDKICVEKLNKDWNGGDASGNS